MIRYRGRYRLLIRRRGELGECMRGRGCGFEVGGGGNFLEMEYYYMILINGEVVAMGEKGWAWEEMHT